MVLRHKEEKKIKYSYLLLTLFICLTVLLAACTKTVEVEDTANENADEGNDPKVDVKEPVLDVKDTKTEIEQNQELLTNLIADGTYSNEVTYDYHSGSETVKIDITVEDDVVTDASMVSVGDTHKYSQQMIDGVNAALPELVIGKKINEINLPKNVAGSSLTTAALREHLTDLVERY